MNRTFHAPIVRNVHHDVVGEGVGGQIGRATTPLGVWLTPKGAKPATRNTRGGLANRSSDQINEAQHPWGFG